MEELISVISNVGFPIFIAMFLLIRVEAKIDQLISAFMDLMDCITELTNKKQGKKTVFKIYKGESEVRDHGSYRKGKKYKNRARP